MRSQAYLSVHTAPELGEVAGESAGNRCVKVKSCCSQSQHRTAVSSDVHNGGSPIALRFRKLTVRLVDLY